MPYVTFFLCKVQKKCHYTKISSAASHAQRLLVLHHSDVSHKTEKRSSAMHEDTFYLSHIVCFFHKCLTTPKAYEATRATFSDVGNHSSTALKAFALQVKGGA